MTVLRRLGARRCCLLGLILSLLPGARIAAQIIPIRSVPLAQGDQFLLFPSANLGMGGVSLAFADTLLDPFRNPAMGARVEAARLLAAPSLYGISRETGGGRTLPLAVLGSAGSWFGGLAGALQQIENSGPIPSFIGVATPDVGGSRLQSTLAPGGRTRGNNYLFAALGRTLGGAIDDGGWSLGGSVLWSRLDAVSGADLLYPGSQSFTQSGHQLDFRLGVLRQWPDSRSLEALVLHDRFAMTDDITYLDVFWDAGLQQFVQVPRVEHDRDRYLTTGAHLAYQMPLSASGWRIGWIGTVNLDRQPRIARDEIVTLPRDQGRSAAWNLGVGFAKSSGAATFGLDLVYEPIRSTTWAVADEPVVSATGVIPAGGRTSENRFRFSNVVLRLGVSEDWPLAQEPHGVGLQLGLAVRSLHYRLTTLDFLAGGTESSRDSWVEWSPTWGLSLRFPALTVRYAGRITNGDGRPSPFGFFGGPVIDALPGTVLVAPTGTLNLLGVSTVTHQISLSLPLH